MAEIPSTTSESGRPTMRKWAKGVTLSKDEMAALQEAVKNLK